jgi:hypothetical protein
MSIKRRFAVGYGCLILALFFLAGCEVQHFFGELFHGEAPDEKVTVTDLDLTALVTTPVTLGTPDDTIDETQYTGSITWEDALGTQIVAPTPFAASTVYTATVTLTAKDGYTFTGVAANSFTHDDATPVNAADSGTVTITFPST